MGVMPGTRPTGPALKAAKVAGGPEVAAAASSAQRQRQQIDAIKARRKPAATPPPAPAAPAPDPSPASPGDGPAAPAPSSSTSFPVAAGNAGGGFLLGVALWAVGLAYLKHGPAGVRQLLAAKFLNKVATS